MAPRQRDVETPRRRKRRKLGAPVTVGILNEILSDGPQPKRRRGNNVTEILGDVYDIPPSTPPRRSARNTTKLQSSGLKRSYREESDDEDERGKRGEMDDGDGRDGMETPANGDEQENHSAGENIVEEDYRAERDNEDKGDNDNKERSDNGDLDNEEASGEVSESSHDNGDVSAVVDPAHHESDSDNEEETADNGDDATPKPRERQDEEMESFEGNVVQMFSDAPEPEQDPNWNEAAMPDQTESPEPNPPLELEIADLRTDAMDRQVDTRAEDELMSSQEAMGDGKEEEEYLHDTDPEYDQYSEDEAQDEEDEEQNKESEDGVSSSKPLVELTLNDALRDWLYETTKDTAFKKDWMAIVQSIKDRQHQKDHLHMPSYLVRSYLRIQTLQNFYGEIGGFVNLVESDRKEIRKLTALADIVINDADQGILNFPNWPWHEGNQLKFTRIAENVETCLVPHLHILVILGFNIYYRHQDSSVGIDQFHCMLGLARETIDHLKRLWDRGCILGKRPPRTWRLARHLKRLEEALENRTLVPLPASSADPSQDFHVVPYRPWSKKEDDTLIEGLKAARVE